MAVALPIIGDWYQRPGHELFEVVAVDAGHAVNIEAAEDAWHDSRFNQVEPPEDYSGSLDMDAEDVEREIEPTPHREWSDPLEFLDQSE